MVTLIHAYICKIRKNADFYACAHSMLVLPSNNGNPDNGNQGDNLYKVTKMVADETDTLVCSFTDGSLYAWDLFNNTCNYHIDRR